MPNLVKTMKCSNVSSGFVDMSFDIINPSGKILAFDVYFEDDY